MIIWRIILGRKKGKCPMKKVLVVVDMQKDFIDGVLGTKEAVRIVDRVVEKIVDFDGEVVFTRDTHFDNYLDTQEGRYLPVPHCKSGSNGWQLQDNIAAVKPEGARIFDKSTFASLELVRYLSEMNEKEGIEKITFVGVCTDICVISNAMVAKAYIPEVKIAVDAECCAGVTLHSHNNALEAMRICQIIIQ